MASCEACKEGISQEEWCERNPGMYDCDYEMSSDGGDDDMSSDGGDSGEYDYKCAGDISSFDEECSQFTDRESCESYGVSIFSDGKCGWVMDDDYMMSSDGDDDMMSSDYEMSSDGGDDDNCREPVRRLDGFPHVRHHGRLQTHLCWTRGNFRLHRSLPNEQHRHLLLRWCQRRYGNLGIPRTANGSC